jgi:aryl-alcohol dehydrogenase-like predicted oxidoreductase
LSNDENYEQLDGHATARGTKKYVDYAKGKGKPAAHFRLFDNLHLSSIGMGTYLGELTAADDKAVEEAVYRSIESGAINVIDTAINYRSMRSEKSIGRALSRLVKDGIISRDEVFVCTKNGYITNDGDYPSIDVMEYMHKMYISTEIIKAEDISSGYNVLNPKYIARCVDKSLANMHLNTIDLVYIHNAFESWHGDVSKEEFMNMLSKVFEVYEKYRALDKIHYYGMATWTCFRVDRENTEYLSLEDVVKCAERVSHGINPGRAQVEDTVGAKGGGAHMSKGDGEKLKIQSKQAQHGFRFIQLPYNLAYSEALFLKNQRVGSQNNLTILEAANRLNIGVFTSIPLFQSRLLNATIPDYAGLTDPVAKIIQVIRSSPSVIAPLIGQKRPEHVEQNLKVANLPPLNELEYNKAIQTLLKHD